MNPDNFQRRFTVAFEGWTPAFEVFPIENADGTLIGGFLVIDGPVWKCFISRVGYPESLTLEDSENPPWITPLRAEDSSIVKLVVSNVKTSEESKRIRLSDRSDDE
jgi:hypothetical protein